jgi:hypothetical protein
MFRQKRLLKKEKIKVKVRLIFAVFVVLLIAIIGLEYLYFNFGSISFISPLAKSNLSKLVSVEDKLSQKNIPFSSVTTDLNGAFRVKLLDGGEVILSSKKDIGSQLSSLQLMLARLTIEGRKLKALDFRFDNPVVSF